jgi:hypothetical protein
LKQKFLMLVVLGVAVAVACLPGFAHYGSAAYDTNLTLTFKGTVMEFRFINPHCQIYFDINSPPPFGWIQEDGKIRGTSIQS